MDGWMVSAAAFSLEGGKRREGRTVLLLLGMVQWGGDTWAASHDEDDKDGRDDTDPSLFLRRNDVTIPPYSFRVQSPFFSWKKKNHRHSACAPS